MLHVSSFLLGLDTATLTLSTRNDSALFSVLQTATVDLRDLRGPELTERAKYAELVMKVRFLPFSPATATDPEKQCLWKVSKTVKESLEARQLLAPRLLRDINIFLIMIPPAEWRRRATDNVPLADMPLRTVKTILQQVVSVFGEQVFDQLDEVESAENSFVYQYLFRLASNSSPDAARLSRQSSSSNGLRTAYSKELPSSPPLTGIGSPLVSNGDGGAFEARTDATPSPTASTSSAQGGAEIEMNNRLKAIFDLIGDPVQSRKVRLFSGDGMQGRELTVGFEQGIAELYEFQKLHPEAEARIASWSVFSPRFPRSRRNLTFFTLTGCRRLGTTSRPTSSVSLVLLHYSASAS